MQIKFSSKNDGIFIHFCGGNTGKWKLKKTVRITDKQRKMLDFLISELGISENDVFRVALVKLYKDLKNNEM